VRQGQTAIGEDASGYRYVPPSRWPRPHRLHLGPPWADGSGLVPGGRGPYICAKTNWYRFFSALETRRLHATASYLPAIGPHLISSADLPGIAFRTWFYAGAEITGRTR
jgi:hypothetical protein